MVEKNCACAGCTRRAMPNNKYCSMHMMEGRHIEAYPLHYATVGETRFVNYGNKPEDAKNKL